MLLIILAMSGYFVTRLFKILVFDFCKIELHHKTIFPLFLQINGKNRIKNVFLFADELVSLIYLNLTSIPLYCISIAPVIVKCVKRCREKEDQYRYSYEKLKPLIRKYP